MIDDIRLQHFRSYQDDSFEFETGVNIIVGPNAAGKTNLLEAIQTICLGASYRTRDLGLIQKNSEWARIDSHSGGDSRSIKLERNPAGDRANKTFTIGGKSVRRLPQAKALPLVLFEPNHLQLLTGSKESRRDYLDDLLEQTVPGFGATRRQYKRALSQRNALLKHGLAYEPQLFVWNIRLSELGGKIATERISLLEKFNAQIGSLYRQISGDKVVVKIVYESTCDGGNYCSNLLSKLESAVRLDFQRGFTAYGPHRDDFLLTMGSRPAADVASRGEIRTLLLSLKLFEMKIIEDIRGRKPILLLDDVFSELDGARRRALTEFLNDHQAFITTTDADIVVQHFMGSCHIIPIQNVS